MGYASSKEHPLVDTRLFLPKEWMSVGWRSKSNRSETSPHDVQQLEHVRSGLEGGSWSPARSDNRTSDKNHQDAGSENRVIPHRNAESFDDMMDVQKVMVD